MRVLLVCYAAPTHLMPIVPLCTALESAGHEVLVASGAGIAPTAEAAGLQAVETGVSGLLNQQHNVVDTDLPTRSMDFFTDPSWAEPGSAHGRRLWESSAFYFAAIANYDVESYYALAARWRPDLVLCDPAAPVGRIISRLLDVPLVAYRWGIDPTHGPFEERMRDLLAVRCRWLGLDGLPNADLVLDPCPPSLQVDGAPAAQRMRYIPHDSGAPTAGWALPPRTSRRVCVTMGLTLVGAFDPAPGLCAVAAAAALDDVEVVLTTSGEAPQLAENLPKNVRIAENLPLASFLHTCDAVIHHGGSGTGLTACSSGIPQLVLPRYFNQYHYGRNLAAAGAGVTISEPAEQRDVDRIRAGLRSLLDDASCLRACQKIQAENHAAPLPADIVPMLRELSASHRHSTVEGRECPR